MSIIRTIPWPRRPPTNTPIKNIRGLKGAYVFDGDKAIDVTGQNVDATASTNEPGWAESPKFGRGARFSLASDTRIKVATESEWDAINLLTNAGSVALGINVRSIGSFDYLFDANNDNSNGGLTIQINSGADKFYYSIGNPHDRRVDSMVPTVGEDTTIALTTDNVDSRAYLNGVLKDTFSAAGGFDFESGGTDLLTFGGAEDGTTARRADVDFFFFFVFDRTLDLAEILSINNDPWNYLFQPRAQILQFPLLANTKTFTKAFVRHAQYGGVRMPYGSFAGKVAAPPTGSKPPSGLALLGVGT